MPTEKILCPSCNGVGGFEVPPRNPLESPGWRTCPTCNGSCHIEVEKK